MIRTQVGDLSSYTTKYSSPALTQKGVIIANMDADKDVTLKDVAAIAKEVEDDELEPVKLKEVVEVVTSAKLMIEVVTVAAATITAATTPITAAKETATPSIILHSKPKSKDKGKWIMVQELKPLKKKTQIEHDKAYARELKAELNKNINWDNVIEQMDYFKGISYDDIRPIFEKYFNYNVAFLEKTKEQMEEEDNRALKRKTESSKEKATKKQKLDEEIVKERFVSSKPKNFSDDFLLTTFTYMFEKPDVQAQVWKNQKSVHGLVKVKSWRLLDLCRVHIITFTTTQMILLVERRYPLTRFTLDQILNNVRLEVKEDSEVSLELLRFVRKQQQEGFRPE
nr:hypothetical protein [Tanacetum cinerariifolium]